MNRRIAIALVVALSASFLFSCTFPSARQGKPAVKNIIIMIGDGMGYNHYQAASLFLYDELEGQPYNAFPVRVAVSTYAAGGGYDPQAFWADFASAGQGATDSAAAATALATGSKTFRYGIGVDVQRRRLRNIVEAAEESGRSTGVVTTVPISHATPAGFVAHNPTRKNYQEIAREMIFESGLEVLMGSGHPWYDHNGKKRAEPASFRSIGGKTTWDALRQGTSGGDCDGDGSPDPWFLIEDRRDFQKLAKGQTPKRVIGIARVSRTLQQGRGDSPEESAYASDQPFAVPFIETVPTLPEMTRGALNVLDEDPDGFFLMVEGGAIDWASHANQSGRMIEEQIDFDHAVAAVISWVETHSNWDETLLIVTADHECGFLNGPGRPDQANSLTGKGLMKQPGMQWQSEDHTNFLVPLFAKGAGAESFRQYLLPTPDPVRGPYLDNTSVGKLMISLFKSAMNKK
jgi:alkaline phosphatase